VAVPEPSYPVPMHPDDLKDRSGATALVLMVGALIGIALLIVDALPR
jgi:hypothetical protein